MALLRRNLGLIFRTFVTVILLAWLSRLVNISEVWDRMRTMDGFWVSCAFLSFLPVLAMTAFRWKLLLAVLDLHISLWRSFELGMIGQFFNAMLIGTTGGDVVKIFYVTRLLPQSRSAAAFTVIEDRVIGMVALLCFGTLLSLSQPQLLFENYFTSAAMGTFYFFAAAGVVGSIGAILGPWILRYPWCQALLSRLPAYERLKKAIAAYILAAAAWRTNICAVIISLCSHMASSLMGYCLVRALHLDPPLLPFIAVFAVVNFLIALPASISGLGVREALFVKFLALFGINTVTAGTFSLSCFAISLAWSAVGGLFYLLYRHETHDPAPNTSQEDSSLLSNPD